MKKFVLLINLLFVTSVTYGQDTSLDQSTYIYEANQPLYNLINSTQWDPNNVTWTTASDDGGTLINLNFGWTRWGQTFDKAWQSSNGCLSFTGICYGYTVGENGYMENTLYPLWTDLIAAGRNLPAAAGRTSKMAYYGDNEKMIFGWYNMWENYRDSKNSFEVVLWADSGYEFRYGSLDILNHNVYIGEEGNSNQEGGKTLNTYLYFNRYASGVNYGLDQHLANIGVNLEGASLYARANTYYFEPGETRSEPPPPNPCDADPQYSPNCPGYVEPYNQNDDLTGLLTGTDLIFGDEPSDFYGINSSSSDYGIYDPAEDPAIASIDYGDNNIDYGDMSIVDTNDTSQQPAITEAFESTGVKESHATGEYVAEKTVDVGLGFFEPNIYDSNDTVVDEIFIEDALEDNERGREEIQKALGILSSLAVAKTNPALAEYNSSQYSGSDLENDSVSDNTMLADNKFNLFGQSVIQNQQENLSTFADPTMVANKFIDAITDDYTQSESSTNNNLVDELLAKNKNTSTVNSLFDQLLATGATTIGQIVSGVQPDYTKFDVKPLPQEEQQTLAKAEAQLETMSQQDVNNNLDEYNKELQESGGFNSNAQTVTMLLMARVQGYNYGDITLSDRPTFYTPKSVYTTNAIRDNNNNLRLLLTDDRHRELVNLQY